jgi:hypothetical protein
VPGETLKEFLVAIGFEVDENSYGKFNTKLGRATAGALELGSVVTATATAVEVAVAKMARQFEDLFYVSQRTQSSVRALQSFDYAARTIGVTSDQARGAVEGLARAMRGNPGVGALLNQLGVKTAGRGSVEIMNDLVGQLRKLPFYLAAQYGQIAGIDPETLLQYINNYEKFQAKQKDISERQKADGVDYEKLSTDSTKFGDALRSLEATLGFIGDRILQDFVGPATKMIQLLDEGAREFIVFDKATNGWASTLSTIGTSALAIWIGKLLLAKVLFRGAVAEAAAAAAAPAAAGAAAPAAGASAAALARVGLGRGGGVLGALLGVLLGIKYDESHGNVARTWLRSKLGIHEDEETGASPASRVSGSRRDQAVAFFIAQGWTREQALGLVANLQSESKLNTGATGDGGQAYGIAQWHKDRQENFRRQFGKDIHESSFEEQLQFVQFELAKGAEKMAAAMIRQSGSAADAGAAVSRFYERPGDANGQAGARGALAQRWFDASVGAGPGGGDKNVTINADTKVVVASTDPKQAAREVVAAQDDAAARAARYAGTAVR